MNSPVIQAVPLSPDAKRLGFLCADQVEKELALTLFEINSNSAPVQWKLGSYPDLDELEKWSLAELESVAAHVLSDSEFATEMRTVGSELARKIMTQAGAERLAQAYKLIDRLVIFTSRAGIPWEWICPPPSKGRTFPMIGETWQTVRWPADKIEGTLLSIAGNLSPCPPLRTFGLGNNTAWRQASPADLASLFKESDAPCTLHLVGHYEGDHIHLLGSNLKITVAHARNNPIRGVKTIILSSCKTGASAVTSNLAIAFSHGSECAVCAPLVAIRDSDAEALDLALASYFEANNQSTIDDFMRAIKPTIPALSLYVQYGLHRS